MTATHLINRDTNPFSHILLDSAGTTSLAAPVALDNAVDAPERMYWRTPSYQLGRWQLIESLDSKIRSETSEVRAAATEPVKQGIGELVMQTTGRASMREEAVMRLTVKVAPRLRLHHRHRIQPLWALRRRFLPQLTSSLPALTSASVCAARAPRGKLLPRRSGERCRRTRGHSHQKFDYERGLFERQHISEHLTSRKHRTKARVLPRPLLRPVHTISRCASTRHSYNIESLAWLECEEQNGNHRWYVAIATLYLVRPTTPCCLTATYARQKHSRHSKRKAYSEVRFPRTILRSWKRQPAFNSPVLHTHGEPTVVSDDVG